MDILCEMMMSVLVFDKRPIVSQISRSLCGSTLEVASSKIIYCASESSALAIPIFWRCPPESAAPAFPTSESSPFGSVFKKLPSPASDNASFNFSSFAFGSASNRFSRMVPENRLTCCGTMAMFVRSCCGVTLRYSFPSIKIVP